MTDYPWEGLWDRYGSTYRSPDQTHVDLTDLDGKFIPLVLPSNIHEHRDEKGELWTTAFTVRSRPVVGLGGIEGLLAAPGLHYLQCVADVSDALSGPGRFYVRMHTFLAGTDEAERPERFRPDTMRHWLGLGPKGGRFPHACPFCKGPAFVGITQVDCERRCR